ncbi:MAG TPA: tetratricopeptide repeat protein, partial [Polyangia bacterium]
MFFDRFRDAVSRLPDGLIRTGPPASPDALAQAEAALGRALPPTFKSFLQSFDGVDLFQETVVVAGVGPHAARRLVDLDQALGSGRAGAEFVFAETPTGDRFAFRGDGAILRLRGSPSTSDEEVWLAGTEYTIWLEAVIAHERLLFGPDGEFSPDAFEPDGAEILPRVALRQAEKALRLDPGSAELHHERGVALRRLGRDDDARPSFRRAAELDPGNPWPWFELGRAALAAGVPGAREALESFERAGRADPGEGGAQFWVWAARAALLLGAPDRLAECRREALARAPELAAALHRAREEAAGGEDPHELEEAQALLDALEKAPGTAP